MLPKPIHLKHRFCLFSQETGWGGIYSDGSKTLYSATLDERKEIKQSS
jgi:hypothetical protein